MKIDTLGSGGGAHRKLKDPAGKAYVVQAARSGFVAWSRGGAQGPVGWVVHTIGTGLVNRLVWQGDDIAPKRTKVWKRRYRTQAAAVEAVEDLAATIARSGLPQLESRQGTR